MVVRRRELTLAGIALIVSGQQGQPLPKFFTAELKDEWSDLESSDYMTEDTCNKRAAILKTMAKIGDQGIGQFRASVLEDQGYCGFWQEDYKAAIMRFEGAISEYKSMTQRDEDAFLKPPYQELAPVVFVKNGALALGANKWSEAAMFFRRLKIVAAKNMDKQVKMIAKHNNLATAAEIKKDFEAVKQKLLPQLMQHKQFASQFEKVRLLDGILKRIDNAAGYQGAREKAVSSTKYLQGLLYSDTHWSVGHPILEDIKGLEFPKDVADSKLITVINPSSKEAHECDEKVFPELCKLLKKKKYASDITANVFGGAKILNAKSKKAKLEICESNASIGLLYSARKFSISFADGVKYDVEEKTPIFVNYCKQVELEREGAVLFIQMWHPHVAPIERTTFIRNVVSDKDHANKLAKLVNDASITFEKTLKAYGAAETKGLHHNIENIDSEKKTQKKEADIEKAKESEALTEAERLENVKKLEEERQKKAKADAEKAEIRRQKAVERAQKVKEANPWLETVIKMKNSDGEKVETTLKEQQEILENLREEKRELDRQLEFGQGVELVKDINAQERKVKSAEKLAKKAYEKAQKGGDDKKEKKPKKEKKDKKDDKGTDQKEDKKDDGAKKEDKKDGAKKEDKKADHKKKTEKKVDKKEDKKANEKKEDKKEDAEKKASKKADSNEDLEKAEATLEKLKKEKAEAIEKEDYKAAKKIKAKIEKVNEKIKELEGKQEL